MICRAISLVDAGSDRSAQRAHRCESSFSSQISTNSQRIKDGIHSSPDKISGLPPPLGESRVRYAIRPARHREGSSRLPERNLRRDQPPRRGRLGAVASEHESRTGEPYRAPALLRRLYAQEAEVRCLTQPTLRCPPRPESNSALSSSLASFASPTEPRTR